MDAIRARMIAVAVVTVTTAATLIIAEFAIRWLGPSSDRHYVIHPHFSTITEPNPLHMPGVTDPAEYRISSDGIRGVEFSESSNEYRILAIGGSTTQNTYLDQSETWTIRLSTDLVKTADGRPVWSGDVGQSGHTARSHVVQFESLIPELPRIDTVVFLVGVNDMMVALQQGPDYEPPRPLSDPTARYEQKLGAFQWMPGRFHERATLYRAAHVHPVKRTALYQIASQAKRNLVTVAANSTRRNFGQVYERLRSYRSAAAEKIDRKPDLSRAVAVYESYLEQIVALSRAYDVRIVFLTQPSLWRPDLTAEEEGATWLGGLGNFMDEVGHDYYSARVLADAMQEYNEATLAACVTHSVECIDLAPAIPRNLEMFYDDVHYTEAGAARVAEVIVDYLSGTEPFVK